jgi:hypothetical protein
MTENGPQPYQEMKLGIPMQYLDDGGSQSCFSPDGTKYARMTPSTGLFFMDFDRSSGQLSNFKNVRTGSETNDHSLALPFHQIQDLSIWCIDLIYTRWIPGPKTYRQAWCI